MRTKRNWTADEDDFVRVNYIKLGGRQIALELHRTLESVQNRARILKVAYPRGHRWTPSELEFLRANYSQMEAKEIANSLNLRVQQVKSRVVSLGLEKGMTEEKRRRCIELATRTDRSNSSIAKELGVSSGSVRYTLRQEGIERNMHSGRQRTYEMLKGFRYEGSGKKSEHRHQLLFAYHNTCWDCKRAFANQADLEIHHDFTQLPVQVVVLCKSCHLNRHVHR
jgi:hypothetical protein